MQTQQLTLSPSGPLAPLSPSALGAIGPSRMENIRRAKQILDVDQTYGRRLRAVVVPYSPLPMKRSVYTSMTHTKIVAVRARIVEFCFQKHIQICETILIKMTHESLKSNKNLLNMSLTLTSYFKINTDGATSGRILILNIYSKL